jgi:hypothetical protein
MVKKLVIEVRLVDESMEETNRAIEKEVYEVLSENSYVIPWAAKIEKIAILED